MWVRTDDEVYRVDAVWLGPPKLTLPWRARYVSYLLGTAVLFVVLAVQRVLGVDFGVLSAGWALAVTVVVVRVAARRISDEQPLRHVLRCWWTDARTPRPVRRPEEQPAGGRR